MGYVVSLVGRCMEFTVRQRCGDTSESGKVPGGTRGPKKKVPHSHPQWDVSAGRVSSEIWGLVGGVREI